jgi:predicted alpha/beta hydrolase family esterase
MGMKFLIFHCWGGNSRGCWRGWLADKLRAKGMEVVAPEFPETHNPDLEAWLAEARRQVPRFRPADGWVLVGHSLGCPTLLRVLEGMGGGEKAKAAVLVSGFATDLGISEVEGFVEKPFDWEKIRKKADRFIVINSDNDPFIELGEGKRIAKLLGAELIVEHGAGHINEGSGFTAYPRLLELLLAL